MEYTEEEKMPVDEDEPQEEYPSCEDCLSGICPVTPEIISRFIIRQNNWTEISLEKAKGILVQSGQFSGVPVSFDSRIENSCKIASVFVRKVLIAESRPTLAFTKVKEAEQDACLRALKKLQNHCFTILEKTKIDPNQKEIGTSLVSEEKPAPQKNPLKILGGNIGQKLMEKMGWSGGGIGKKEQGIKEPISVTQIFAREGLGRAAEVGAGRNFSKAITAILQDYIASPKQDDLVFASDFSNDQRKQIHGICGRLNLKSISFGKDADRQLTVQKKRTAQELLLMLLENGGENGKYSVLPPATL